ncbi:MAG: hypothetical protein A2Z95_06150 [Gallionellales bacterium GWA2_60_18]|nr:MAG: hypothetical protein A2Z95_06150 [Gallionellales bacterium GWA2_60_18]
MRVIPIQYRILAVLLLALACVGFGYVQGVTRESDRRDALELRKAQEAYKAFQRALDNGKRHAAAVIEWQRKAGEYYNKWQWELDHEPDLSLARCANTGEKSDVHAVLLGPAFLRLYNGAWLPGLDLPGDPGGTSYALVEAGTVTPREVLGNVAVNARLCGEDRKRLDELIDHLNDVGAIHESPDP